MVLPDWTDVSGPDGAAWLRLECKIPLDFSIEPLGSILPTSGLINKLPFSTLSLLEGGVRFPLDPLLVECLSRWGTFTTQCSANVYRVVMGVCALNRLLELDLGYNEIMYCYSLVRTKVGLSYLQIRPNRNYLVTNLPDSSSGKEKHYVNISGPLIDPKSEFAASFPVGFGNKASKKINRNCQLPSDRKKLVHQVWQFSERSAHTLLQYTPRYKSFISQHKDDVPLSSTGTSSESEKTLTETEERTKEFERTLTEADHGLSSSDSNKTDPAALQKTPTIDNLSLSSSSDSSKTRTDNIISLDSESSGDMERNIPSVKDILKRKATPTSASPKDKKARVSDAVETTKGKDGQTQEKPSRPKNTETTKRSDTTKKIETVKASEIAKNTEVASFKPPKDSSNERPPKELNAWQPRLVRVDQGSSRPILPSDTVEDPTVALGLSEVFLLPKDKDKCQSKTLPQVHESGLSHIGQIVNVISDLHRRCTSYEGQLKEASKREGMMKTELSEQSERLRVSVNFGEEMKGKLKETELRLIKGSRRLLEATEGLEKAKAEGKILSQANSELKKQVAEFPSKLIAEYNAGADEGVQKASQEIPEILEEQWADGFRRAWAYALRMANIEPSSDLFNRCDEAMDLTRSQIIGEQALNAEPSPAINPTSSAANTVSVQIVNPELRATDNVEAVDTGAKEDKEQPKTKAPSKDPPA